MLKHAPFGYGAKSTGGSTNASAAYLATNAQELREAIAVPWTKTVYVQGVINGAELDNGTPAPSTRVCNLTSSRTPRNNRDMPVVHRQHRHRRRRDPPVHLRALPAQPERDVHGGGERGGGEQRDVRGPERDRVPRAAREDERLAAGRVPDAEGARRVLADGQHVADRARGRRRAQRDQHQAVVGGQRVDQEPEAGFARGLFPGAGDVPLELERCVSSHLDSESRTNPCARYDAISMVTSTNIWVDGCELQDQLSGEYVQPDVLSTGWEVSDLRRCINLGG